MITVAISGGVDSLAALLLLKNGRMPVSACHAILHPSKKIKQKLELLSRICARLDVPLKIVDLQQQFAKHVLEPSAIAYKKGETPNPCVLCNRQIKFGFLKSHFLSGREDFFATGHYAKLADNPYLKAPSFILAPPADKKKNQTYFLSFLQKEQLGNLLFPLSDWQKQDVKRFVAGEGFQAPDEEESQDLCFDAETLLKGISRQKKQGPIFLFDLSKGDRPVYLGQHAGLENYTIGQRKGLGISSNAPLYVVGKNIENNALFVGKRADMCVQKAVCKPVSLFVPLSLWPKNIFARLRYKSPLLPVEKTVSQNESLSFHFENPVFPGAPGQAAVIYDSRERILGAGIIREQADMEM